MNVYPKMSAYDIPVANDSNADRPDFFESFKHPARGMFDERLPEERDLEVRVKRPVINPSTDDALEDKKFTEDLHARQENGRFIESSGRAAMKHHHKS